MTFSILVGLKNNLNYSQNFYRETRLMYPDIEIVFVSYNSIDGTHEWLDWLRDDRVRYYYANEERTLSETYNKCTELATSDYVIFAHNDMVLAPGFIEALAQIQTEGCVTSYTTIEPPIFADDERPGKLVRDFGYDVTMFRQKALFAFAKEEQERNRQANRSVVPCDRATFFLCISRNVLLEIGGLDPLFNPMFCEDDDLLLRLKLKGLQMVVSLNALCYHFVSRTSRFSPEYEQRTKQIEAQSNRNFIRKWGFRIGSPVKKKYDIGFVITNGNLSVLRELEPWCSELYTDINTDRYWWEEQPKTSFSLIQKIKSLSAAKKNGILVSLDARKMNADRIAQMEHLHEIIEARITKPQRLIDKLLNKLGIGFRWNKCRIVINDATTYETSLIYRR